jgi:plasmid stabilization system protein ParE
MPPPRIVRTPEAHQYLVSIWTGIAREANPATADAFLTQFSGALEMVARAPNIGRPRPEFRGVPRSVVIRPYVVFYEPLPDDDGILIWCIIRGSRADRV